MASIIFQKKNIPKSKTQRTSFLSTAHSCSKRESHLDFGTNSRFHRLVWVRGWVSAIEIQFEVYETQLIKML